MTYSHEFENEDKIQVIAGYSALESRATSITASRDSLATNSPDFAFLSNSLNVEPQIPRASDGISETAWIGQFVRATYDIGNQWSLMGTLRYDGSSRFGLNNRFGMFPSFSAAWNLTERPWFDEKDWIDFFKVRGSWGRKRQRRDWRLRLQSRHCQRAELHLWQRANAGHRFWSSGHRQPRFEVGDR